MPRGVYDRVKAKGKRGRRPVPVIFDEDIKIGTRSHRVKITVDPRNFALELSGGGTTFSSDIPGLMKQVGKRLGTEALHNLHLTQFASASDDIIRVCTNIGTSLDSKLKEVAAEQARDVPPED